MSPASIFESPSVLDWLQTHYAVKRDLEQTLLPASTSRELGSQGSATLSAFIPAEVWNPGLGARSLPTKAHSPALELYSFILLINLLFIYLNLETRPHCVAQPGLTILLSQPPSAEITRVSMSA